MDSRAAWRTRRARMLGTDARRLHEPAEGSQAGLARRSWAIQPTVCGALRASGGGLIRTVGVDLNGHVSPSPRFACRHAGTTRPGYRRKPRKRGVACPNREPSTSGGLHWWPHAPSPIPGVFRRQPPGFIVAHWPLPVCGVRYWVERTKEERTIAEEGRRELEADLGAAAALTLTTLAGAAKAKEDLAAVSAEAAKLHKEVTDLKFAVAHQRERNAALEEARAKTTGEHATLQEEHAKTIRENADIMLSMARIYGENAENQRRRLAVNQGTVDHAIKVEED